jgi:hypothetical protein
MRSALLKTNADGDYILKLTFDKEDGLSNGDKVKCTVDYDKDYLKKNKIKLKNTEFTVEVKDLKEGEAFDYFDGVTVTFEGISGKGYADVNTYDAPSCISYDYEYFSSLSNGDTYTVTAKYAYGDLQKTGDKYWFTYNDTYYIVDSEKATKDFPVSGLTELKAVDPFDGLAFETSGGLPYLKVTGVNTDGVEETVRNNVYYSIESYDGVLNVGDTFTVKASASYYLESEGYTLEGVDSDGYVYKEYTIDDSYPSYVTSDDGIAAAESVRSQIDDLILDMRTDIKGTWYIGGVDLGGDVTSIDSFDKVATYVSYTNKKNYDSIGWNSVNSVIELYKIKVTLEVDEDDEDATGDGTKTFYAAITINDVVKSGDEYSANNTPSAAYYDSESDFESQVVDVEDYSVTKCGD